MAALAVIHSGETINGTFIPSAVFHTIREGKFIEAARMRRHSIAKTLPNGMKYQLIHSSNGMNAPFIPRSGFISLIPAPSTISEYFR